MKKFLHNRTFFIGTALLVIVIVILMLLGVGQPAPAPVVSASVDKGSVRQLVSVSGISEAKQSAELTFPVTGVVKRVMVEVGATVAVGDILATLDTRSLQADRQDALAFLSSAQADRAQLIAGPQSESRLVTDETVALKEAALTTTKENEQRKIENARQALLSSNIAAYSNDSDEEAVAPTISGAYTCDEEGTYELTVYSSGGASGYSYRLTGLETGTYSASTEQALALGTCGLRIIFDKDSNYSSSVWYVEIPNTKSAAYTVNKNTYDQAVTQARSAIALAEQELTLAKANRGNTNAPARSEAVTRADAAVSQARARLARIDASIEEHILRATFSGTVTEVNVKEGETITSEPIISLLGSGEFQIIARVPEIDVGKLAIGQNVEMRFDAKSDEVLTGVISFISLKETLIDGVAYYEAYIKPSSNPNWIRSGLNADIDIIFSELTDTIRIPTRFLISESDGYFVLRQTGETISTTTINVTLEGNDGFVAITGLTEGDTLIAP